MPTTVKDDNFLNFITSQEKYIDKIYKKLVDSNCMFKETKTPKTSGNQWEVVSEKMFAFQTNFICFTKTCMQACKYFSAYFRTINYQQIHSQRYA